jgi:GT2 family glycosyltransferase
VSASEPTVTVVLVARAEPAARLARAVASVDAQTYPGGVEVLVATPAADRGAIPPGARWIENRDGGRSAGLNAAVAAAAGDVIVRVDARSQLPADYIERCVDRLLASREVGVVGGIQRPVALPGAGFVARGIARALRNPWATGGADYRRPGRSGPTDTVYLGAFRRADLLAIGGWDETLDANEDFELCQRFRRDGFIVSLEDVEVPYEPRATVRDLGRQYIAFGRSKVRFWRRTGDRPNRRQLLAIAGTPFALPLVFLVSLADPVRAFAYAAIIGGWWWGAVAEWLRRSPASAPTRPSPASPSPGRP